MRSLFVLLWAEQHQFPQLLLTRSRPFTNLLALLLIPSSNRMSNISTTKLWSFTFIQVGRGAQRQDRSKPGEQGNALLPQLLSLHKGGSRKLWEQALRYTTVNISYTVHHEVFRAEFSSESRFGDYLSFSKSSYLLFCVMSLQPAEFARNCTAGNCSVF